MANINGKPHTGRKVTSEEYHAIASDYLRTHRKAESWQIVDLEWDGKTLLGYANLLGYSLSATDNNRFHLPIFAAREMEAQFSIIGTHLAAGITTKTTEIWQLSCHERCHAAITQPDNIFFEIEIKLRKSGSKKIFIKTESRITGRSGGMFTISTTGMMEIPPEKQANTRDQHE